MKRYLNCESNYDVAKSKYSSIQSFVYFDIFPSRIDLTRIVEKDTYGPISIKQISADSHLCKNLCSLFRFVVDFETIARIQLLSLFNY